MTDRTTPDEAAWIKPGEAAAILGVDPKTVARLGDAGEIRTIRPAGNHRRYNRADVEARAS
jgi:excisionase family DNA binding protein